MTDVIFNGSTQRQPVGKAAIELVFDNSDHSLQGEYSQFAEISVRREVTRDAQSNYFLNGTRCRRRDITDLFLGTGLGPRSYAIIEQGMISRFIEAKPDELRTYVEEAAGVSRYKERRKETESRLKRTRENLERLADLEDELSRQLSHLKRQAEAAKRFKSLGKDIQEAAARLAGWRWYHLEQQANDDIARIDHLDQDIKRLELSRATLASQVDVQRQSIDDAQQALEQAQADYYSAGAQVSKHEQRLASFRDQRRTLAQSRDRLNGRMQSAQQQLGQDQRQQQQLLDQLTQSQSALKQIESQLNHAKDAVDQAEAAWRQARQDQQQTQQYRSALEQSLRVAQQRHQQAQRQIEQHNARRQRLLAQCPELPVDDRDQIRSQTATLETEQHRLTQQLSQWQQQSEENAQAWVQWQDQDQALRSQLRQCRTQITTLQQVLASQASDTPGATLADRLTLDSEQAKAVSSALGA